jgi:hypothetical protein
MNWKSFFFFVKKYIYYNEKVYLYVSGTKKENKSPIEIKYASLNNLENILSFQSAKYIDIFKNFLAQGDVGYFAYFNNECVHRSWVVSKPRKVSLHPFLSLQLKENDVYIHYCETASKVRGNNIFPTVLSKIIDDFNGKNIYISCNSLNMPSIKAIEKAGFKRKSVFHVVCILSLKRISKKEC